MNNVTNSKMLDNFCSNFKDPQGYISQKDHAKNIGNIGFLLDSLGSLKIMK